MMRNLVLLFIAGCCVVAQNGYPQANARETRSLNGKWRFVTDPEKAGLSSGWAENFPANGREVTVPHTWNVMEGHEDYRGLAWYSRTFEVPAALKAKSLRLRFAAVYRDAVIYINGQKVGEHLNSGYTTFHVDISKFVVFGATNTLTLSVDNSFSEAALPYKDSFDWSNDGGIIRDVDLIATGRPSIRFVHVTPVINFSDTSARADVKIKLWEDKIQTASFDIEVKEWKSGKVVANRSVKLRRSNDSFTASFDFSKVNLWHFNDPFLYQVQVRVSDGKNPADQVASRFGFRKVVLEGQKLLVNNEPVRLPGIEYMPSSHPDFGSAEPKWVMDSVVYMLKDLNAVITRFHWQVDEYILDRFDEEGILVQAEIPWWQQPAKLSPQTMATAKSQLSEMVERDFNHPSIFAWGISNEVFSSDSMQYYTLRDYTKSLDTTRLAVIVSNETFKRRERDESFIADLPTWNDYIGTWFGNSTDELPQYLEQIESFLGSRPLLITENGLCEPRFPGGDLRRIEDMIYHYTEWAKRDYIVGCIYFSLNDYRTHRGEDGDKRFKARIHGVTDLYFNRKPSYYVFKQLASPVLITNVKKLGGSKVLVTLRNKNTLPSYQLKEYRVVWRNLEGDDAEVLLPPMKPGDEISVELDGIQKRFEFNIQSPTGYYVTGYPLAWPTR